MCRRIKFCLSLLAWAFFLATAQAQEFTANLNKNRVAIGEQFMLTFSINANGGGFRGPRLDDFLVVGGPAQSQNMSIINGNVSQELSFTYYLVPKKEGKFVIGSASIQSGGRTLQSKPIQVEVKGNVANTNAQTQNNGARSGGEGADAGNQVFIRAVPSKTRAYVGEPLSVTFKVYLRINVIQDAITKMPSFNGFWNEDIAASGKQAPISTEVFDGVSYKVAEIKRTVLIPQRSGKLEIDPLELDIVTRQRSRSNDPFDQLFGGAFFGGYQDVKLHVKSKPVTIDAVPLPSTGKPADFSGAVGDFQLETKIKPNSLSMRANDGGTYTLILSGKGNLKLLEAPPVLFPADLEGYDAKVTDQSAISMQGITGRRVFDFPFIPRHAGTFVIPATRFSYFNPSTSRYVTLQSPAFTLQVSKGEGGAANPLVTSSPSVSSGAPMTQDIAYIKEQTVLKPVRGKFFGGLWYFLILALSLVPPIWAWVRRSRMRMNAEQPVAMRQRHANRVALQHLKSANSLLQSNQHAAFYKEMLMAIDGYCSDRMSIPVSELNAERILQELQQRKADAALVEKTMDLRSRCVYASYAPAQDGSGMQLDYQQAVILLTQLETHLKQKGV
jgi:hypothetical protein